MRNLVFVSLMICHRLVRSFNRVPTIQKCQYSKSQAASFQTKALVGFRVISSDFEELFENLKFKEFESNSFIPKTTSVVKTLLSSVLVLAFVLSIPYSQLMTANADIFTSSSKSSDFKGTTYISSSGKVMLKPQPQTPPSQVFDILQSRFSILQSGVTGQKLNEIRVGESLLRRLRSLEIDLNQVQQDIFADEVDWEVVSVYPKIFQTYSQLFTLYTDRAFPTSSPIDSSLRYALRYEIGGFYSGVRDFEDAIQKKSQRQLQRAFARMSLSYDHYYKAGDLYDEYEKYNIDPIDSKGSSGSDGGNDGASLLYYGSKYDQAVGSKLNYIAPSIEAPTLQDDIVMIKGPDKGRNGVVLWIAKGDNLESSNVVVKLDSENEHKEVKLYPYSFIAKTTPPGVQFFDDLLAAYVASALSCGIMYPIDTYKTRLQIGKSGIPSSEEGGFFSLWRGVQYFVADANDAVYVASYGLIKPLFLAPVDPSNPNLVFLALVLSGSFGDALGSIFRVPMEIVYKRIQACQTNDGISVLASFGSKALPIRTLLVCWIAILLRDMPFAGLQIALYDIYKNLFAFLDELGYSAFFQTALWGILAGGTAAAVTTPFDVITTSLLTSIEEDNESLPTTDEIAAENENPARETDGRVGESKNKELILTSKSKPRALKVEPSGFIEKTQYFFIDTYGLLRNSFSDVVSTNGMIGLFNGVIERVLFFGPAAMIFFSVYESAFKTISVARENHGLWF